MIWKKRNAFTTIEEVVLNNVKMTKEEFFDEHKKYTIKFLKEAIDLIKFAIWKGLIITIIGDYDVDGITSSAEIKLAIERLAQIMGYKVVVNVRLPKRFSEGFGLSEKIVDEIDSGLLITVDNGIVAFDAIKKAKDKGLKVIITDHHLADESGNLPNADIIINPHLEGAADFPDYCGAGIVYKLAEEMLPGDPILDKLIGLAAIGTIADVMPLIRDNRNIVKKGLQNLVTYNGRTHGLGELLVLCDLHEHINETNIGFKIGPIFNACGRLEDDGARKPYNLLVFDGDYNVAREMAQELIDTNDLRKRIVEEGMKKVEFNIAENCLYGDYPLVVYEPGLNEGVVGILAGRIAEDMKVPCVVMTDSEKPEVLKGSARTYGDYHMKESLDKAAKLFLDTYSCTEDEDAEKLFVKYGGHKEAAGISVLRTKFEEMRQLLQDSVEEYPTGGETDTAYYDLEINASQIPDTIKKLDKYAPFGQGNPQVIFKVNGFSLSPRNTGYYRVMGNKEQHLKLFGKDMDAVAFDKVEAYKEMVEPKCLDFLGVLSKNWFRNTMTPQVECIDMHDSSKSVAKPKLQEILEAKARERYA